jgi:hypothetical protein
MNKKIIAAAVATVGLVAFAGCSDADVASKNMSKEADNFQVLRQIVVYNGITDKYILEVKGFCSLGNDDPAGEVSYTCKTGPDQYTKDIIKKSDNTFVFVHQLRAKGVSSNFYEVNFKPSAVVPDVKVR